MEDTVKNMKDTIKPQNENVLTIHISDKGFVSSIYKELFNNMTTPLKDGKTKTKTRHITKNNGNDQ